MELYRGYVLTNGKQAIEKFKGVSKLKTYDDVKDEQSFAGVLSDDAVLIDIDDMEQSEIMMNMVEDMQLNCKVTQTSRGRHFVFRNTGIDKGGTGVQLACGLIADVKVGKNNSYQVLKLDGAERFVEWDAEEAGEYDPAPKWAYPVKSKHDFVTMDAGDGRNNALFTYILTLNRMGFTKDESREVIRIINKYVLIDPLSEDEIETITRDDAFPDTTFFKGKTFLHNNFAEFIRNNDNIKKINGTLHVYRDGAYVNGTKEIEFKMIRHLPNLKGSQRQEVMKYLDIITPEEYNIAPAELIAFENGVYDMRTGKLIPFSPDIVVTNKIPWEYHADAYSEICDKTLNKMACQDKDIRALLEECIGYCFYRKNELSKAFVLTGQKANGKSTFLDMIKNVLGMENYSALDLDELDERFSVATMAGRLANIGDDISDEFLHGKAVASFKKIVSGNQVKAEFKGQDPFFFNPYVKLLFSANDIPRMKDKTGAVLRRLVIVPFNATFTKDDPDHDPWIGEKLKAPEVMSYLIKLGLEGLNRVIMNKSFTESDKVKKELKDYELQNNPILLFLQEKELWDIVGKPTKDVHRGYRMFCMENGFTEMTLTNFSRELARHLGVNVVRRRIDGKLIGIYVKGETK